MDIATLMVFYNNYIYAHVPFNFKVQWLQDRMTARDFTVSAIHGDQSPEERKVIMKVLILFIM